MKYTKFRDILDMSTDRMKIFVDISVGNFVSYPDVESHVISSYSINGKLWLMVEANGICCEGENIEIETTSIVMIDALDVKISTDIYFSKHLSSIIFNGVIDFRLIVHNKKRDENVDDIVLQHYENVLQDIELCVLSLVRDTNKLFRLDENTVDAMNRKGIFWYGYSDIVKCITKNSEYRPGYSYDDYVSLIDSRNKLREIINK